MPCRRFNTESLQSPKNLGWKQLLNVTWSNRLPKAGMPSKFRCNFKLRSHCKGPGPAKFWKSLRVERRQPPWAEPSQGRSSPHAQACPTKCLLLLVLSLCTSKRNQISFSKPLLLNVLTENWNYIPDYLSPGWKPHPSQPLFLCYTSQPPNHFNHLCFFELFSIILVSSLKWSVINKATADLCSANTSEVSLWNSVS